MSRLSGSPSALATLICRQRTDGCSAIPLLPSWGRSWATNTAHSPGSTPWPGLGMCSPSILTVASKAVQDPHRDAVIEFRSGATVASVISPLETHREMQGLRPPHLVQAQLARDTVATPFVGTSGMAAWTRPQALAEPQACWDAVNVQWLRGRARRESRAVRSGWMHKRAPRYPTPPWTNPSSPFTTGGITNGLEYAGTYKYSIVMGGPTRCLAVPVTA